MEKDTLLELMIHEISEIERLIETFKGKETISKPFINLARIKVRNVLEELDLLEELTESDSKKEKETAASSKEVSTGHPDNGQTSAKSYKAPAIQETSEANEARAMEKTAAVEETQTVHEKPAGQEEPAVEEKSPISKEETVEAEKTDEPVSENSFQFGTKKDDDTKPEGGVLGETLGKNKSSFNDLIAKKTTGIVPPRHLTAAPVSDLHKAMGINDRFFYQRELFGGNANLLNQTVDQLNQMQTLTDARSFLKTNFNWDDDHEAVAGFLELVERRFT